MSLDSIELNGRNTGQANLAVQRNMTFLSY